MQALTFTGPGIGDATGPAAWAGTAAGLGGCRGWKDDVLARFLAAADTSFSFTVTRLCRGGSEELKGSERGWVEEGLARFLAVAAASPCCLPAAAALPCCLAATGFRRWPPLGTGATLHHIRVISVA